jgi:hypothetical protein
MSNDSYAVSVKDAAGAYVRANDAFLALLGVEPDDLPGLRDDEIQPRDVAGILATNDRAALGASAPLLVEEPVCDRVGRRHVAACRFVTEEEGRALLWRVSGPPDHAAEVAAEAERLRLSVGTMASSDVADRQRARERIGRLQASLAEARSLAALPDPRPQAALRALAGVAEALREPLGIVPATRAVAERLAGALGFDAAVTWRPARMGGLECASVWTGSPLPQDFEDSCWHQRRQSVGELKWDAHADGPHGMHTIVTVGLAHGGAIDLLAQDSREPDPDTLLALEAATQQLAIVHTLTELARQPRWEVLTFA